MTCGPGRGLNQIQTAFCSQPIRGQQLTCDWEPEAASYEKVRAVSVLHSGHSDVTLLLVWAWCSCVSRLLTIVTRTTIDKLLRMSKILKEKDI